jgi:signal transduction histidine kinase
MHTRHALVLNDTIGISDYVFGDFDKLLQVVINILNNAAKYAPAHSTVTISLGKEEKTLYIRIADEGKGIAKEDLPKIFNKYYQSEKKKKGLGLGLYLVRSIVRLHGGHITVVSTVGKGTTLTIFLPSTSS